MLFEVKDTPTPEQVWRKKHGIQTYRTPKMAVEEQPWNCWIGDFAEAFHENEFTTGETEMDAIVAMAKRLKIPLWFEEEFANRNKK